MLDLEQLKAEFPENIARLERLTQNMVAINLVEHAYGRLTRLKIAVSMDLLLEIEDLTTGLVMFYGRLFTQTTGTTKLIQTKYPPSSAPFTNKLCSCAMSVTRIMEPIRLPLPTCRLRDIDHDVVVTIQARLGMWMGPAKHWAPLFVWLQSHIAEMLEKSRVHLSQKSGVTWRMNAEPPSQPPRIIVVDQER